MSIHCSLGVLVLSQFSEPAEVLSSFENGSDCLGYLLKEQVSPGELDRVASRLSGRCVETART